MGVDAARDGSEGRDDRLESTGLGTVDRKTAARTSAAGDKPPAQNRRTRAAGGRRIFISSSGRAGCSGAGDRQNRSSSRSELVTAATYGGQYCYRSAGRAAVEAKSGSAGMEIDSGSS